MLECVPEASSNAWVRCVLAAFAKQCHYQVSESHLQLESVWPCRRKRWWVLSTADPIGRVPLVDFPKVPHPLKVADVLPEPIPMAVWELEELRLSSNELEQWSKFADPAGMLLSAEGIAPTFVHSCGSQVLQCPCGCRSPFSDTTLQKRGIYGVLLPCNDVHHRSEDVQPSFRHPHPWEVALLTGCQIPMDLKEGQLRLWLSGLGQQATPFQSLWIGAQLRLHLENFLGCTQKCDPKMILTSFLQDCLDLSRHVFETGRQLQCPQTLGLLDEPSSVSNLVSESAFEVSDDLPVVDAETEVPLIPDSGDSGDVLMDDVEPAVPAMTRLSRLPHDGDASSVTLYFPDEKSVVVGLSSQNLCASDLMQAEKSLSGPCSLADGFTGLFLDSDAKVAGCSVLVTVACESFESTAESIPATIPFHVSEDATLDPLAALTTPQLLEIASPSVTNVLHLHHLAGKTMAGSARLQILERQGTLMADDEIRFHVYRFVVHPSCGDWAFMDPLLAEELMLRPNPALCAQWLSLLQSKPTSIALVVRLQGHWIPFSFRWTDGKLRIFPWISTSRVRDAFAGLFASIRAALGFDADQVEFLGNYRPASDVSLCGISSVKYLEREMLCAGIPPTFDELLCEHESARRLFADIVRGQMCAFRPWIWANGLEPTAHTRLVDLLTKHGVPSSQVETRIQLAIQALGLIQVQKGFLSNQPWKMLKSIANQCRPTFQWILPDELAKAVELKGKKDASKPKGSAKKTFAKAPAKSAHASAIDPTKLRFDEGTFSSASGKTLSQLQSTQLGPLVEGVALATTVMVDKFLQSSEPISEGALAIFLTDAREPSTGLVWNHLRVAVRCIANGEPVLISGTLVQLGNDMVGKASVPVVANIPSASAACSKIVVYRDGVEGSWESFIRSPVNYVAQHLPCLDVCTEPKCGCPKWHKGEEDTTSTPMLDVWRKQWLNLSFQPVRAHRAEVFVMNVRRVESLAGCGHAGIFAEPRSIDARSPSSAFQIIWLLRVSLEEVMHLIQANPDLIGAARMGSRLGVRVESDKAAQVSSRIRPDNVVLANGDRFDFEMGPLPYGMDRAGVAALCKSLGWTARAVNPVRTVPNDLSK